MAAGIKGKQHGQQSHQQGLQCAVGGAAGETEELLAQGLEAFEAGAIEPLLFEVAQPGQFGQ